MMETELDKHPGYEECERNDNSDSPNGAKHKMLNSYYIEIPIAILQDHGECFEPQIV